MRIRNKLLLAMAVPAGLLAAQIASVSFFVRQQQSAVLFISLLTRLLRPISMPLRSSERCAMR